MKPVAVRAKWRKEDSGTAETREMNVAKQAAEGAGSKTIRGDMSSPYTQLKERMYYAPMFCDTLSFSAGRERSLMPAATRHHFITGAQKKTVFGPGGGYDIVWFEECMRRMDEVVRGRKQTVWVNADRAESQRGRRTCRVVHERGEARCACGCCCARHCEGVRRRVRGTRKMCVELEGGGPMLVSWYSMRGSAREAPVASLGRTHVRMYT